MKNQLKKLTIFLSILFTILVFQNSVNGQIVNIEDRRGSLADTTGWFGFVGLGGNFVKNTKSILSISGDIRTEYHRQKARILFLSNYNLIRVNQDRFIDNGFQHFRYNDIFRGKTEFEIFAQAQYNNRVRITFRGLLGGGLRFPLLSVDQKKIFLGIAYMYEYDEIKIIPETISYFRDHRMSSYLSVFLKWNDSFSISNTTYYQPVLNNFSDVRLSSQTNLKFSISKKLSFITTFNITNDTRVPEGVPASYYSWRNGIRWDF